MGRTGVVLLGATLGTVLGFYIQEQLIQRHRRKTDQFIDAEVERRFGIVKQKQPETESERVFYLDKEVEKTIGMPRIS